MDYEKKYKEALEKAKDMLSYKEVRCEDMEYLFPELKESEDERIRKALIRFHKSTIDIDGIKGEQIVAWLEKQGEKGTNGNEREIPFLAWNEEDEKIREDMIETLKNEKIEFPESTIAANANSWIAWLEKRGEQKQVIDYPDSLPKDNWELIHEFVIKFGRMPKDEDELNVLIEYVLKRQNPSWSEEDDIMAHDIDYALRCQITYPISKLQSMSNWIDNLKGRVQPKQEWSEEDEKMINIIIEHIHFDKSIYGKDKPLNKAITWLKSLRH